MTVVLQEGVVFAGRYRVVRCIASGGMGAVYEVIHVETERRRALKVMLPHVLQNEEMRERFKREAKVAAHVESEHIVDVFDAGVDDATQMPFLVMELLRGEELGKRIKRTGRLDAHEALAYLHQTALALDETHRASIVHRDLKPENIFLVERKNGHRFVKVLDFGVAKIVAEGATAANATQVVGTPLYMAPEQFRNDVRLTPAADIYALGMMAYTMLIGRAYWGPEARGGNVFALAAAAMTGPREPASVRAWANGVQLPPGFDAWFAVATAPDPTRRFPGASALVRSLADVFTAMPLAAPPLHQPALARSGSLPELAPPSTPATPGVVTQGLDATPPASASPSGALTPPIVTTPAIMTVSSAQRSAAPNAQGTRRILIAAGILSTMAVGLGIGLAVLHGTQASAPAQAASAAADDVETAKAPSTSSVPAPAEQPAAPMPTASVSAAPEPSSSTTTVVRDPSPVPPTASDSAQVAPSPAPSPAQPAAAETPAAKKEKAPKGEPRRPATPAPARKFRNKQWSQD